MVLNSDKPQVLSLDSANAPSELGLERDMSKKAFVRAEEEFSSERSKECRLKDAGTGADVGSIFTVAAFNHHDLYDTIDYHSRWRVLSETSIVFCKPNTCAYILLFEPSSACLPENDLLGTPVLILTVESLASCCSQR